MHELPSYRYRLTVVNLDDNKTHEILFLEFDILAEHRVLFFNLSSHFISDLLWYVCFSYLFFLLEYVMVVPSLILLVTDLLSMRASYFIEIY